MSAKTSAQHLHTERLFKFNIYVPLLTLHLTEMTEFLSSSMFSDSGGAIRSRRSGSAPNLNAEPAPTRIAESDSLARGPFLTKQASNPSPTLNVN